MLSLKVKVAAAVALGTILRLARSVEAKDELVGIGPVKDACEGSTAPVMHETGADIVVS